MFVLPSNLISVSAILSFVSNEVLVVYFFFVSASLYAVTIPKRNSEKKNKKLLTLSTASLAEVDPCSMTPCSNGGTCLNLPEGNYMCTCRSGWTGKQCEVCKYTLFLTNFFDKFLVLAIVK